MVGVLTGRRGGKQRDRLRGEAHVASVRGCSALGGRVEGWKEVWVQTRGTDRTAKCKPETKASPVI